jgi:hypothetical protein
MRAAECFEKSELLRLAQVDRMLCYSTAVLANEFRISDQPLVLFKVFLDVAHILQKAEMLLMLGMGHLKAWNFNHVGHSETSSAILCANLNLPILVFKLLALDFFSFGS